MTIACLHAMQANQSNEEASAAVFPPAAGRKPPAVTQMTAAAQKQARKDAMLLAAKKQGGGGAGAAATATKGGLVAGDVNAGDPKLRSIQDKAADFLAEALRQLLGSCPFSMPGE